MSTVLITGGTGYIGSHICVELLNNNYNVIIIDNLQNSDNAIIDVIHQLTNKKPIFYPYDMNRIELIDEIFANHHIDIVIHCAGLKSVSDSVIDPINYYFHNINITINLLKIMKKNNCKKIIFSSSCTVYGKQNIIVDENTITGINIQCPYGKTKYCIEEMLKDMYLSDPVWSIIILRYFNPVGCLNPKLAENPRNTPTNLMPYIIRVVRGIYDKLTIYGNDYDTIDGTCIRDFVHVVDIAKGHYKALCKINEAGIHIYNLGTGNGVSVLQLITTFEKCNNIKINYVFGGRRQGDVPIIYADIKKAHDELDWVCEKTIEDMCVDSFSI